METINKNLQMDLSSLRGMILSGKITMKELVEIIYSRIESYQDYNTWIYLSPKEEVLKKAEALQLLANKNDFPLFGIPYGVKDNIDVADVPTTAACREFAYIPKESAESVKKLESAGGLFIGKTNMDQFATGLVGTRSPYGIVKNSFDPEYISGGSSSGSAIALALGMVSFSLGTDTAGSGRVPAGFNNLFGLKPTKGIVSTKGVVPACKSLDCVSVFALTSEDAGSLLEIIRDKSSSAKLSADKTEAPFTFAVPKKDQLNFSGNTAYETLYYLSLNKFKNAGGTQVEIDFALFLETAELLYEGPWVAERLASIKDFFDTNANDILVETKKIIEGAKSFSAVDTFLSLYKLEDLKIKVNQAMEGIDLIVVPTTPTIYKITDIEREPFTLNKNLGYYTNFVNLLDLCALAVPNGFQPNGLPMGITMISAANNDLKLLQLGKLFGR